MGSRGCPKQGSKHDHEERKPGQGRIAKPRLLTRPWESYWPRTGGRGGKNSTSVHMGSLLLDTECLLSKQALCGDGQRLLHSTQGEGRGLGFYNF